MQFQYFQSKKNNQWYWRLKADNWKIIADGSEGYDSKADCLNGISLVKSSGNAEVVEVDE